MVYLKISKESVIKLIETIKAFSKIAGCKINVEKLFRKSINPNLKKRGGGRT